VAGKLFLIRHGATSGNKGQNKRGELMRGQSRIELDANGRAEAQRAGARLKGKGIEKIYASDLPRTRETARIIARELGNIPVELDPELRTWDPGILTGKPVNKVQGAVEWYEKHPDAQVPDGEKMSDFLTRQKKAYDSLIEEARTGKGRRYDKPHLDLSREGQRKAREGKVIAAVTHSRPLLAFQADLKGQPRGEFHKHWDEAPGPGSVVQVDVPDKGKPKMRMIHGSLQTGQKS
jgi:broad specificity phosphatase PhoE